MARGLLSRRGARNAIGCLAALGLHAGLLGLFALSLETTSTPVLQEPAGGAISVGLVRATRSSDPSADIAAFEAQTSAGSANSEQPSVQPNHAEGSSLLAQMDASAGQTRSSQAKPESAGASASPNAPKLGETASPWSRASVVSVDGSKARDLWRAAQRCWHGGMSFNPTELRIVLDGTGAVTSMTWVGGGDAGARVQAQAVAAAISACGPYRTVVATAGTYLVIGPLA